MICCVFVSLQFLSQSSLFFPPLPHLNYSHNTPPPQFLSLSPPRIPPDLSPPVLNRYLIWRRRLLIRFSPIPIAGPVRLGLVKQGNVIRGGGFQAIPHLPQREVGSLLPLRHTMADAGGSGGGSLPSASCEQQREPGWRGSCQPPTRHKQLSPQPACPGDPRLLPPSERPTLRLAGESWQREEKGKGLSRPPPWGLEPLPQASLDHGWEGEMAARCAHSAPPPPHTHTPELFFFLVTSLLRTELCQASLDSSSSSCSDASLDDRPGCSCCLPSLPLRPRGNRHLRISVLEITFSSSGSERHFVYQEAHQLRLDRVTLCFLEK